MKNEDPFDPGDEYKPFQTPAGFWFAVGITVSLISLIFGVMLYALYVYFFGSSQ